MVSVQLRQPPLSHSDFDARLPLGRALKIIIENKIKIDLP
jgi:hypothetical protein